ncbi:unnamed protein product [Orchesella dallaii]|uniref:Uncharacterized protein n=1 Tax=Orchesella dallaii TaxID=48710 RepID=A0ABP1PHG7_9HEXA
MQQSDDRYYLISDVSAFTRSIGKAPIHVRNQGLKTYVSGYGEDETARIGCPHSFSATTSPVPPSYRLESFATSQYGITPFPGYETEEEHPILQPLSTPLHPHDPTSGTMQLPSDVPLYNDFIPATVEQQRPHASESGFLCNAIPPPFTVPTYLTPMLGPPANSVPNHHVPVEPPPAPKYVVKYRDAKLEREVKYTPTFNQNDSKNIN